MEATVLVCFSGCVFYECFEEFFGKVGVEHLIDLCRYAVSGFLSFCDFK